MDEQVIDDTSALVAGGHESGLRTDIHILSQSPLKVTYFREGHVELNGPGLQTGLMVFLPRADLNPHPS
jgi:hypothetical protein